MQLDACGCSPVSISQPGDDHDRGVAQQALDRPHEWYTWLFDPNPPGVNGPQGEVRRMFDFRNAGDEPTVGGSQASRTVSGLPKLIHHRIRQYGEGI